MINTSEILNAQMVAIKENLIESMRSFSRVASGQTIDAIEIQVAGNVVNLLVPTYIDALEVGRQPTSPDAPAGDPTVLERIKEWLTAKGLSLNPYAVTKNIHKKGYPGKVGVITIPLSDDNLSILLQPGLEDIANSIGNDVLDLFNFFD